MASLVRSFNPYLRKISLFFERLARGGDRNAGPGRGRHDAVHPPALGAVVAEDGRGASDLGPALPHRLAHLARELEQRGYLLYGRNVSDDLFMYIRRQLNADDGIVPSQAYRLSYRVTLLSDGPTGCMGIGGAPGEGVVLKLGAGGAMYASTDGERVRLPAAPVRVVDTTGAGDALCAGFLAGSLSGASAGEALQRGIEVAAKVVGQVGARPGA
jgi:hypothetical protein